MWSPTAMREALKIEVDLLQFCITDKGATKDKCGWFLFVCWFCFMYFLNKGEDQITFSDAPLSIFSQSFFLFVWVFFKNLSPKENQWDLLLVCTFPFK